MNAAPEVHSMERVAMVFQIPAPQPIGGACDVLEALEGGGAGLVHKFVPWPDGRIIIVVGVPARCLPELAGGLAAQRMGLIRAGAPSAAGLPGGFDPGGACAEVGADPREIYTIGLAPRA
jgi:hypothetical protein